MNFDGCLVCSGALVGVPLPLSVLDQTREIASKADKAETEALRAEKDKEIDELKAKNKELERRLDRIEGILNSK